MQPKHPMFGPNATGRDRLSGTPKMDDWGNPNADPLAPVVPVSPQTYMDARWKYEFPVPVVGPRHLCAPEGARTVDLRRNFSVANGSVNVDLLNFQCLPGMTTVFYSYSLIYYAAPGTPTPAGVEWHPTIDGMRVLQYHGSPGTNLSPNPETHLDAATAFDFSSTSLDRCQILMNPNQIFRWGITNTSGGPLSLGVRLVGYVDATQQLQSTKFGD